MTLEVHVKDEIIVFEAIGDLLKHVDELIYSWFNSDDKEPLVLTIHKVESTGPPALGVSVGEKVATKDALR